MDKNDFYIVLPSNVQSGFHSGNTASCFRVTFDESYNLEGADWEVALMEITYLNSMYNITNESFSLLPIEEESAEDHNNIQFRMASELPPNMFMDSDGNIKPTTKQSAGTLPSVTFRIIPNDSNGLKLPPKEVASGLKDEPPKDEPPKEVAKEPSKVVTNGLPKEIKKPKPKPKRKPCLKYILRKGYYKTPQDLVKELNSEHDNLEIALSNFLKKNDSSSNKKQKCEVSWAYNEHSDRILVAIPKSKRLRMKKGLHELLGFKQKEYSSGIHTSDYAPLLNRGIYNFFVYCDLCAPIQVGNIMAPLLRSVKVPHGKKWGSVESKQYILPLYIPVNKNSFNSILMDIRDDTGTPIHFSEGKTTITLHFRRRT